MDHHRPQGQALRERIRRLRRRETRARAFALHRRASSLAMGARHRPRRRGYHHAVHLHRDRRNSRLPRRAPGVRRRRSRHLQHQPRAHRGGARERRQQTRPRDPAGALRRPRLRHGSHPQHRAHLQFESRRGRRARRRLRASHGRPRDGENRHHRRPHLLQLLCHQEFHHRRRRHDHHRPTTRSRKKSRSPVCTG